MKNLLLIVIALLSTLTITSAQRTNFSNVKIVIVNYMSDHKILPAGSVVEQVKSPNEHQGAWWICEPSEVPYVYHIRHVNSGKYLSVNQRFPRATLRKVATANSPSSKTSWEIIEVRSGEYRIRSHNYKVFLTIQGLLHAGADIHQALTAKDHNTLWRFSGIDFRGVN